MFGVTEKAKAMADIGCYVPMGGFTDSFNISHAAAIMMYHAVRDRITKQVIIWRSSSTNHCRHYVPSNLRKGLSFARLSLLHISLKPV